MLPLLVLHNYVDATKQGLFRTGLFNAEGLQQERLPRRPATWMDLVDKAIRDMQLVIPGDAGACLPDRAILNILSSR